MAAAPETDFPNAVPTRYWTRLDDGRVRCDLCPRACSLADGQRGLCFVRAARGGEIVLAEYGRATGFCVDPIEKKPLNHFLPGTSVLSFGTAGCNLACSFCQNWDTSKSRDTAAMSDAASPLAVARAAKRLGCRSVAFTYNDPVVFMEYAIDVAQACHAEGIRTVAVTAGYICDAPRREFYRHIDAANVDLKAFSEDFYWRVTKGKLQPVLDTLVHLRHETRVWLEITTLLIPGANDSDAEIAAMSAWIARELGPDGPLQFSAFHPAYRMTDRPNTPPATLARARRIARDAGLRHVYVGNVEDVGRQSTWCHGCGGLLIERDRFQLGVWRLDADGRCLDCGTDCPGHFERDPGRWGRKRLPVRIAP